MSVIGSSAELLVLLLRLGLLLVLYGFLFAIFFVVRRELTEQARPGPVLAGQLVVVDGGALLR